MLFTEVRRRLLVCRGTLARKSATCQSPGRCAAMQSDSCQEGSGLLLPDPQENQDRGEVHVERLSLSPAAQPQLFMWNRDSASHSQPITKRVMQHYVNWWATGKEYGGSVMYCDCLCRYSLFVPLLVFPHSVAHFSHYIFPS